MVCQGIVMSDDQDLFLELQRLSQEFLTGLPARSGAIETAWARLWREDLNSTTIDTLVQESHSLAGVASSLGFEQIALAANELQSLFKTFGKDAVDLQEYLERGEIVIQRLRRAIHIDRQVDLNEIIQRLGASRTFSASLQEKRADRLIYMVEDDPIQAGRSGCPNRLFWLYRPDIHQSG